MPPKRKKSATASTPSPTLKSESTTTTTSGCMPVSTTTGTTTTSLSATIPIFVEETTTTEEMWMDNNDNTTRRSGDNNKDNTTNANTTITNTKRNKMSVSASLSNAMKEAIMKQMAASIHTTTSNGNASSNHRIPDENDDGCLHCHQKVKHLPRITRLKEDDNDIDDDDDDDDDDESGSEQNIQVRCDECQSYICNGCHWCHEFQANHEIRVCDRCDAFYCKSCDEMDQCDDCGEVVCGSCSTLLSCKFCGGGLCEECATACGRCGIVLCSRDAKFAVDCDTCRLSYCLVCLASGSKDPCVRCGHRPSKRMEQLVHLRLKSIYKAFKSSSNNKDAKTGNDAVSNMNNNTATATNTATTQQQSGRRSSSNISGGHYHSSNTHHHHHQLHHGTNMRRNKPTTLQDMVGDGDDEDIDVDDDDDDFMMNAGNNSSSTLMGNAAAGILPEKFVHDLEQNYLAEKKKADEAAEALLAELEEEETAKAQKKSKKKKKKEKKQKEKHINDNADTAESETNAAKKEIFDRNEMVDKEHDSNDGFSKNDQSGTEMVIDRPREQEIATDAKMDPIEKELLECEDNGHIEGIEDILFRLKGVPGKGPLRKNAKKALKRLRAEQEPYLPETEPSIDQKPFTNVVPPAKSIPRQSSASSPKASAAGVRKSTRSSSAQVQNSSSNSRIEDLVEISSTLVGWVIGKGGQRIREMMDESGAKIWVDQEKVKGQPRRTVFVSGDKAAVEHGVRLVRDVVDNAPPPPGSTTTGKSAPPTSSERHTVAAAAAGAWSSKAESGDGKEGTAVPKPPPLILGAQTMADRVKGATKTRTDTEVTAGGIVTEIVSCEARFVPLLIGKRGWTIKNIQDESGAKVDIDQTVTPRQVRISGSMSDVETAVAMVHDVLSYPDAQLLAGSEEEKEIAVLDDTVDMPDLASSPTKENLLAASAKLQSDGERRSTGVSRNSNESPPPLVGDAKSAISASSSLSSTPEPSMASSSKGAFASQLQNQLQNGPLIPPAPQYQDLSNIPSRPATAPFLQPEVAITDAGLGNGQTSTSRASTSPHLITENFMSGQVGLHEGRTMSQGSIPLSVPSHDLQRAQSMFSALPKNASVPPNHGMMSGQGHHILQPNQPQPQIPAFGRPGNVAQHQMIFQTSSNMTPMAASSSYDQHAGNIPQGRNFSAGHTPFNRYTPDGTTRTDLSATTPLRDLMSHSAGPVPLDSPLRQSGYGGPSSGGMWNTNNPSYSSHHSHGSMMPLNGPPGQANRNTMGWANQQQSFQQQQQQRHQIPQYQSNDRVANPSAGLGGPGLGGGQHHQPQHLNNQRLPYSSSNATRHSSGFPSASSARLESSVLPKVDEANVIESLFGTTTSNPSNNTAEATSSLLTGLNGLSLSGETGIESGEPTGLWGPSSLTGDWAATNKSGSNTNHNHNAGAPVASLGDLLSGPLPSLSQDQPKQSRFSWTG